MLNSLVLNLNYFPLFSRLLHSFAASLHLYKYLYEVSVHV